MGETDLATSDGLYTPISSDVNVIITLLVLKQAWRRHNMEILSELLALCKGNLSVIDVFCDNTLNTLNKKEAACDFETSWRTCDVSVTKC